MVPRYLLNVSFSRRVNVPEHGRALFMSSAVMQRSREYQMLTNLLGRLFRQCTRGRNVTRMSTLNDCDYLVDFVRFSSCPIHPHIFILNNAGTHPAINRRRELAARIARIADTLIRSRRPQTGLSDGLFPDPTGPLAKQGFARRRSLRRAQWLHATALRPARALPGLTSARSIRHVVPRTRRLAKISSAAGGGECDPILICPACFK